ncbi:hypothetical protein KA531_01100 [Candidatus Saccharibacteria bacterium]|nr:hypothetical protein [Candidatus Saccharibacteria bacterium]
MLKKSLVLGAVGLIGATTIGATTVSAHFGGDGGRVSDSDLETQFNLTQDQVNQMHTEMQAAIKEARDKVRQNYISDDDWNAYQAERQQEFLDSDRGQELKTKLEEYGIGTDQFFAAKEDGTLKDLLESKGVEEGDLMMGKHGSRHGGPGRSMGDMEGGPAL